jgi:hypothetical protein
MAKKKKVSLEKAAREITAIVEKFLSSLPAEEQERRVNNFEKAAIKMYRAKRATTAKRRYTPSSRAAARPRQ